MRVAVNLIPSCDLVPTTKKRAVGDFESDSAIVKSLNLSGRRTENPPSVDAANIQPDASGSPACSRCIVIPGGSVWPIAETANVADSNDASTKARVTIIAGPYECYASRDVAKMLA